MSAPNIKTLSDTLACDNMPIYTDANASLLGITDATTLNELIEGELVPINSIVKLWVNGNSAYGQEVRSALNTLYNKDVYGYLTIERNGPERHLTIKAYDTLDTFETTYTATNDRGWFGTWYQTSGIDVSKICSKTMQMTFTDGVCTANHNFGFASGEVYKAFCIPYGVQFIIVGIFNNDGNNTVVYAINYNMSSGTVTVLNGTFYVNILCIGI